MKILRNLFKANGNNEGSTAVSKINTSKNQYYCPMKCEGDKTYNAPGNCPVCNMKLVVVDTRKGSHGHSHGCC